MALSTILLSGLLAFAIDAKPTFTCPPHIGPRGVQVRLPPTFSSNPPSSPWAAPPVGWYFKPWNMIYASNLQYLPFPNYQYDPTAIDPSKPAGPVNDLSTFQPQGNATVYTSYGVATPNPQFDAVLEYAGTGILTGATGQYSVLAWGCDRSRTPYYASYSTETLLTATPAGIDIMSINDQGPDSATLKALIAALRTLPNAEIQALVAALTKMTQDGGRDGMPRVTVCDDYCKSNQNLIGILG